MPLVPYPPLRGTFPTRGRLCQGYCFPTHACIRSDDMGIALLSQTAYLRRSSSLFFISLPPSNLRPFGAPPSIGRRECPREPLPLEGAAERSEAGLASFFGGEAASSLPSPLGKGDRAAALGCSYIASLRRSPTLFHTVSTLSSPSWRLPYAGKTLFVGIGFSTYPVFDLAI